VCAFRARSSVNLQLLLVTVLRWRAIISEERWAVMIFMIFILILRIKIRITEFKIKRAYRSPKCHAQLTGWRTLEYGRRPGQWMSGNFQ
jgi:hypothetical protein